MLMNTTFDHERLNVYQEAIHFVVWVEEILVGIVSMLVGLIRSTSAERVHESQGSYVTADGERSKQD